MDTSKDYYRILGVSEHATRQEIRRAYHRLIRRYHPDNGPGNERQAEEVNLAYGILGNQERRQIYDFQRRRQFSRTYGNAGAYAGNGSYFSEAFRNSEAFRQAEEKVRQERARQEEEFQKRRADWEAQRAAREEAERVRRERERTEQQEREKKQKEELEESIRREKLRIRSLKRLAAIFLVLMVSGVFVLTYHSGTLQGVPESYSSGSILSFNAEEERRWLSIVDAYDTRILSTRNFLGVCSIDPEMVSDSAKHAMGNQIRNILNSGGVLPDNVYHTETDENGRYLKLLDMTTVRGVCEDLFGMNPERYIRSVMQKEDIEKYRAYIIYEDMTGETHRGVLSTGAVKTAKTERIYRDEALYVIEGTTWNGRYFCLKLRYNAGGIYSKFSLEDLVIR